MKDKKNKVTLIIQISLFIILVIGATYAYLGTFSVNLDNSIVVNINSVSPGNASFIATSTQLNIQVPETSMAKYNADDNVAVASNTATLSVSLTGAEGFATTCTYDVVYEYDSSSNVYGTSPTTKNGDKEITLQVTGASGTNNFASETNFDSTTISSYKNGNVYTLVSGASIQSMGSQTTQNININGKYYNLTVLQTSIAGVSFTGKIYVTNYDCDMTELDLGTYGYERILAYNGGATAIEAKGTPDFSSVSTTNEGMYAATDDLGTSYYFRGAVDNNWVKFGKDSSGNDIYWRIIRINGDNSIRMIYSGTTPPDSSTATVMIGEGTQIGTSSFGCSGKTPKLECAGYMYTDGEQHGNSTSSTIKTTVDNWYKATTLYTDNETKSLVADQIFCNDRSVTDGTWNTGQISFNFDPYTRLTTHEPILTCSVLSDKFTVNESSGNGALDYPAGLITADEIAMAGTVSSTDNSSYYLYTEQNYWTMSPSNYEGRYLFSYSFFMNSSGTLSSNYTTTEYGVRPVISLSSNVILSGKGTYNDVYTVNSD